MTPKRKTPAAHVCAECSQVIDDPGGMHVFRDPDGKWWHIDCLREMGFFRKPGTPLAYNPDGESA